MKLRILSNNFALLFAALLFCFLAFEIGYRIIDPFPFFSMDEINHTNHGNLSEYDPQLGWKGVPGGKAWHITESNKIWLVHNSEGFRDIEHKDPDDKRPALVFLGDSFTWGYEVEFGDMFVNKVRHMFPGYQVFNLSHNGYGTDQELLTLRRWQNNCPIKYVILMFCVNDVDDNNSVIRYDKSKPYFKLVENELVLSGIPVPKEKGWKNPRRVRLGHRKSAFKRILFHSHFIHDIHFRITNFLSSDESKPIQNEAKEKDLTLTSRLLEELKKEVGMKKAKLIVFFIPSKQEIERLGSYMPYQIKIAQVCQRLNIDHYDLAPDFKNAWLRTYYREDGHWNSHGHEVAAKAIYRYLASKMSP